MSLSKIDRSSAAQRAAGYRVLIATPRNMPANGNANGNAMPANGGNMPANGDAMTANGNTKHGTTDGVGVGNMQPATTGVQTRADSANGVRLEGQAQPHTPDHAHPLIVSSSSSDTFEEGVHTPTCGTEGSTFTTDVGPDLTFVGSHYLKISNMTVQEYAMVIDMINDKINLKSLCRGYKSQFVDEAQTTMVMFICTNDLMDSALIKSAFQQEAPKSWVISYINQAEYAKSDAGNRMYYHNGMRFYDGQLVFIAKHNGGPADIPAHRVADKVRGIAESVGLVLAFKEVHQTGTGTRQFRVEYYKMTDADEAMNLYTEQYPRRFRDWSVHAVMVPEETVGAIDVYEQGIIRPGQQIYGGDTNRRVATQPYQRRAPGTTEADNGRGDPRQVIDVMRIIKGQDIRSTIMVRDLPRQWTAQDLKDRLDQTSFGKYEFSYVRIDFARGVNVGYGFISFTKCDDIIDFFAANEGQEWVPGLFPPRFCHMSYAETQGVENLIERFRNSAVMSEFKDYRPKLWYTWDNAPIDDLVGTERPFPGPNNWTKNHRSLENAGSVGLFPPRFGGGRAGNQLRRSQYDRGTLAQIQEDGMLYQAFNGNYTNNAPAGVHAAPPFNVGVAYPMPVHFAGHVAYNNAVANVAYPMAGANVAHNHAGANIAYPMAGANVAYPMAGANIAYNTAGANIAYNNPGANVAHNHAAGNIANNHFQHGRQGPVGGYGVAPQRGVPRAMAEEGQFPGASGRVGFGFGHHH